MPPDVTKPGRSGNLPKSTVIEQESPMRLARRRFIELCGGTAGAAALGVSVPMTANAQTIVKVGVINSRSGFPAAAGDEMQKGIDLYAMLHMTDLPAGIGIEVIHRDDDSSPED